MQALSGQIHAATCSTAPALSQNEAGTIGVYSTCFSLCNSTRTLHYTYQSLSPFLHMQKLLIQTLPYSSQLPRVAPQTGGTSKERQGDDEPLQRHG